MDISKINTSHLLGLLKLTEKRDALVEELKKIESAIAGAFGLGTPAAAPVKRGRKKGAKAKTKTKVKVAAPTPASAAAAAPAAPKAKRKAKASSRKSGGKRGALKDKILSALREAGAKGVSVKDLSKSLGVKNQNLHVWFSSTGKNLGTIQKVGSGRYRLKAGA